VNNGNLPARNIRDDVKIAWSMEGDKKDFGELDLSGSGTFLLMRKTQTQRGTGVLSASDAARCHTGTAFVYVWGRIEHEDGFGCSRWLIYCHRYNCIKPTIPRLYHHHNDGN